MLAKLKTFSLPGIDALPVEVEVDVSPAGPDAMPTLAWACGSGEKLTVTTNHRKGCKRYDVEGDAHFLTFSCFQRLALFSRERACRWMLEALPLGRQRGEYDLWAW